MQIRAMLMTPGLSRYYFLLIQQRNLSWEELAAEMGISPRGLKNTLMATNVEIKTGWGNRRKRWKAVTVNRIDALEDAITKLTDQRGGVHAASGTTLAGEVELRRQLQDDVIRA